MNWPEIRRRIEERHRAERAAEDKRKRQLRELRKLGAFLKATDKFQRTSHRRKRPPLSYLNPVNWILGFDK